MTITLATSRLDTRLAQVAAALRRVREETGALRVDGPVGRIPCCAVRRRATLLLAAAEIGGGATEDSISLVTVVETLEDSLQAHETVTEEDATTDKVAVMSGDYLMARAFDLLPAEDRGYWTMQLAGLMRSRYASRLRQATAPDPITSEELVRLARADAGAAYRFCVQAGLRTAGGQVDAETTRALLAFGEQLGAAVQLRDAGLAGSLLTAARAALASLPETPEKEWLVGLAGV